MGEMESYKNLIREIESYLTKLEKASLTMDELFELEKLTRKLHERSVILKYKAFENKVGGQMPVDEEKEEAGAVETTPEAEEHSEPEQDEETAVESDDLEFAMLDLSEEEISDESELIFDSPEPEEEDLEKDSEVVDPSSGEQQTEEKRESEPVKKAEETVTGSFLDKFQSVDNSISSQFAGSKLTTLVGAFGLNEKLRFINDLFDGSSEHFSDAVKALDSKQSIAEANSLVEDLANQHSWDPEEEVVSEFMIYIKRRYD